MKTNGGYVILDLQDANVYAQAKNCLLVNKPVMVYDNAQVYYADSIILDGTNVVLTKGGKTITIANDNTITTSGDIQILKNHIYALTFNVSDAYYTVFTTKSCGMNNKIINVGEDESRKTISLTDDEKKSLYDAFKSALTNGNDFLLGSINSDNDGFDYVNYSSIGNLVFRNSGYDNYSLDITFSNNNIIINENPNEDNITIYEKQLF